MQRRALASVTLGFALSLLAATDAAATAQRTFVASYGAAANTAFNCSIAKPCRAFSEAIGVTTATGEVIVLDSAGYGSVTITQSVSIVAPTGIYAGVTVFAGDGITVNAPAATVVLHGLSINGQGGASGVSVQQAARLRIENCVISNMNAAGIIHTAAGNEMVVLDSIVRDNSGVGIAISADASAVLDRVRGEHNGAHGLQIAASTTEAHAVITDSLFAFNGITGISVGAGFGSKTYVQVERSVLADNSLAGLRADTVATSFITVAMTRSSVLRNGGGNVGVGGSGGSRVFLTENTFVYDGVAISVDGSNNDVAASANTLTPLKQVGHIEFAQSGGANFYSYSNNISPTFTSTGTITPTTGN